MTPEYCKCNLHVIERTTYFGFEVQCVFVRGIYVKLRRQQVVLHRKGTGGGAIFASGLVEDVGDVGIHSARTDK